MSARNQFLRRLLEAKSDSDLPFPALPDSDHFGDVNEMILNAVPTVEAGQTSLADHLLEIAVVAVAEYLGEVPA